LVGKDTLSPRDQMILESAKSIREDFLHQIAFDEVDTYTSFEKQKRLLVLILSAHDAFMDAVGRGVELDKLVNLPLREQIARAKYTTEDKLDDITALCKKVKEEVETL
ncbi:MAG TPA: V-type ATP synthase subunit A, partial [Candidatus Sumerlaeota bacterium]|nr:V-type ATP synthase subunit A [Candidatus Sumerlaeota bacterium]